MAQNIVALADQSIVELTLPPPDEEVTPGIEWGSHEVIFTPAFWAVQSWLEKINGTEKPRSFRQGRSLTEEVAACLLGGYRIRGELAYAAFLSVRQAQLLEDEGVTASQIEEVLARPLSVGNRTMRYPFPRRKAKQLVETLRQLSASPLGPMPDRAFRNALCQLPGVGLKTASWITRNWLESNEVAVLDIHIVRAGILLGIFDRSERLPRDYFSMEERFLALANGMELPASLLDAVIWAQMRRMPRVVSSLLACN